MTARETIEKTAAEQGWTSHEIMWGFWEYKRASRHVTVYFDVRGRVISATRGNSSKAFSFLGADKASRIVEELSR